MTPFAHGPFRYTTLSLAALLLGLWLRSFSKHPLTETPSWKSFSSKTSCEVFNYTLTPDTDGLKYCEDLVHWEGAGVVIVSCDGGRRGWNTVMGPLRHPDVHGKIYVYHLDRPHSTTSAKMPNLYPLALEGFPATQDFHPLGLELFTHHSRAARLFVANHRRDRSVVEVFELSASIDLPQLKLTWRRTLLHPLINTPNSIVALSPTSLLITNDHFINRRMRWPFGPLLHSVETLTRFPGANVITLDFDDNDGVEEGAVVIRWLTFANGIVLTHDRATLIIASSSTSRIFFYRVQPISGGRLIFEYSGARKLGFGPDNLSINAADELVVAGHPSVPKLVLFAYDGKRFAPAGSAIVLLDLKKGGMAAEVQMVFEDTGAFFATSSAGLVLKAQGGPESRLIASGLYQRGLLECLEEGK